MSEYMSAFGNWGPVIFIVFVYGFMIAVLGWRGRKKPYRYSLKQAVLSSTGGMASVLTTAFVHFWAGIALIVILAVISIQYADAIDRYIDK